MALYEHVFLVRQDVSAAQVETLTDQLKTIIGDGGGKIEKTEYWGLKALNYRIRKNRKAHFTLMNIDAPHAAVAEMERQMKINEDIIRHLTLRVDEHEEEPSAMVRSRGGRDERRPGFGSRDDRDRRSNASGNTADKKPSEDAKPSDSDKKEDAS